jgi:hypothetical protein
MKRPILLLALAAAGLPFAATVGAQSLPTYEPQQRLRTALDTCLKTEVMQGAHCVQKCSAGFRMVTSGPKAKCVGLSAAARPEPKNEPSFKPPADGSPRPPKAPGA